jgi:hypothetical protein
MVATMETEGPLCLSCNKKPAKSRGLCGTCYQQAKRGIELGQFTETELIADGLMLKEGAVLKGRKPLPQSKIMQKIQRLRDARAANESGQSPGQSPTKKPPRRGGSAKG